MLPNLLKGRGGSGPARATLLTPIITELPADSSTVPRLIVINGNPTAEDLAPLIGLHELYQDHHKYAMD